MMGLTDFNLTPKAKKGLKDAKKFAEANGHTLVTTEHLIYGCLVNLSDSCSLKLKGYGVPLEQKEFVKIFKDYARKTQRLLSLRRGKEVGTKMSMK
jgi:ATP-dependent Clp protease ATP-binding subunit ClpA